MKVDPQMCLERLRSRLKVSPRQVVVILGAGVSIASAPKYRNVLSWVGLLKDGTQRCSGARRAKIDALWEAYENCAPAGQTALLITIAQILIETFGGVEATAFGNWIKEVFSEIEPERDDLVRALVDTGAILLTTNYDTLVEQISDYPSVDIEDRMSTERVITGDEKGVVHLHGIWTYPKGLILDWESYARAKQNGFLQFLMDYSSVGRNLLFVGYGNGMDDPNFSSWIERIFLTFPNTGYEKYMLVAGDESSVPEGIIPLSYGEKGEYARLPAFICSLIPEERPGRQRRQPPRVCGCFGRDTEINELVAVLTKENGCRILVYGPVGIGKGTTVLKALQHPDVKRRFGERQFFINCEKVRCYAEFLYTLAFAVDMPGSNDLSEMRNGLISELQEAASVFLDNFETLLQITDSREVENFLKELARTENLTLVVACRGNAAPFHDFAWNYKYKLPPITRPHDEKIFLRTAGEKFIGNPILRELLDEMEGVPLAIKLLAHQAADEASLECLFERWKRHKTNLLQSGKGASRNESWAISLELTLASPRVRQAERELLSCIAFFPDGINRKFIEDKLLLMPSIAENLIALGLVEQTDGIWLSMLAPIREHVRLLYQPVTEELEVLTASVIAFASFQLRHIGGEGGLTSVQKIMPINSNIEASIRFGLCGPNWKSAARAAQLYATAVSLACIGDEQLLNEACEKAQAEGLNCPDQEHVTIIARLKRAQGKVAEERGNLDKAEGIYKDIETNLIDKLVGIHKEEFEAKIQKDLADIALAKHDVNAGTLFVRARYLFSKGVGYSRHPIACDLGEAAATLIDAELLGEAKAIRYKKVRETQHRLRRILTMPLPKEERLGRVVGKCHELLSKAALALPKSAEHEAVRHLIAALIEFGPTGDIQSCVRCISSMISIATQSPRGNELFEEYITNGHLMSSSDVGSKQRFQIFSRLHLRLGRMAQDQNWGRAATFHYQAAKRFGEKATDKYLIKLAEAGLSAC